MKIGDLVMYKNLHGHVVGGKFISKGWTGLVVDIERNKKGKNIIVMWSSGMRGIESSASLTIISEAQAEKS